MSPGVPVNAQQGSWDESVLSLLRVQGSTPVNPPVLGSVFHPVVNPCWALAGGMLLSWDAGTGHTGWFYLPLRVQSRHRSCQEPLQLQEWLSLGSSV